MFGKKINKKDIIQLLNDLVSIRSDNPGREEAEKGGKSEEVS